MPYFPVDDQFAFHPKAIAAGNSAVGAWARAGSWCKAHTSGGFVPESVAAAIGTKREIAALLSAGLWLRADGGYQFHDWEHQAGNFDADEEKARREAVREKDRERKRAQREREKADRHGGHADSHAGNPDGIPSTPSPSPLTDVTELTESSHLPDGPDSGLDSINDVVRQRAKGAGIQDVVAVRKALATIAGPMSLMGAIELATAIVSHSKTHVRRVDAYVATACRNTPAEVQQAYFDLDIEGIAS